MTYMGSKSRITKHILPIILKDRREGQWYVEPFVGGANVIDKVVGNRLGADAFLPTIQALEQIRDNIKEIPKNNKVFTEENYIQCKMDSKQVTRHDISFAGFAYSFGAKWFGGWCRAKDPNKDYVAIAYRSALKQNPKLQGLELQHISYTDLQVPPNSIIYCDIPYKDTTKYAISKEFNYENFYAWCKVKKSEEHTIFVSEYWMPEDFKCIWEKPVTCNIDSKVNTLNKIEKLFTI